MAKGVSAQATKNASGRFAAAYQGAKGNDEGVSE
jgi:hypothetical protein